MSNTATAVWLCSNVPTILESDTVLAQTEILATPEFNLPVQDLAQSTRNFTLTICRVRFAGGNISTSNVVGLFLHWFHFCNRHCSFLYRGRITRRLGVTGSIRGAGISFLASIRNKRTDRVNSISIVVISTVSL